MKKLILLSLLMVSGMTFASEQPDHSIFDRFLNKYVSSTGKVNYKGMKTQMDSLDAYITELRGTFPSSDWGRNAKKAYYCNAYNAYTLNPKMPPRTPTLPGFPRKKRRFLGPKVIHSNPFFTKGE